MLSLPLFLFLINLTLLHYIVFKVQSFYQSIYSPGKCQLSQWALKAKQCKRNSVDAESDHRSDFSSPIIYPAYRPGLARWLTIVNRIALLLRKEVIQPHLPIRLPCYDFTPIIGPTFGSALFTVRLLTSGVADSHGVTGGVYKARERIHGSMLTCHY